MVICVYTDGSCSNNGYSGAVAGIGIWFGENDKRNVSARISGKQTNNTAELSAIIHTYSILRNDIKNNKTVNIYSDSQYAIRCATTYGEKLKKKGWKNGKKGVPNVELVKMIYTLFEPHGNVTFHHVRAHTSNKDIHSIGNAHADRIANEAVQKKNATVIHVCDAKGGEGDEKEMISNPSLTQTKLSDFWG